MNGLCHRCGGELPGYGAAAQLTKDGHAVPLHFAPAEAMPFCPHCSAPQMLLPEHLRTEIAPDPGATTGALPPPSLRGIDWPIVLECAAAVGAIGTLLTLAGLWVPVLGVLGTLWILASAVIVLGTYAHRRPGTELDGRTGFRIGAAMGLITIVLIACSLALVGTVLRFGTNSMGPFDTQWAEQLDVLRPQIVNLLQQGGEGREAQEHVLGILQSPEVRGGLALTELALRGSFVLLLSAGGGAFAGMLRGRRRAVAPES